MSLHFALRNIVRNPRRSFLLLATVATAVFGIFMFDGFNRGIMNQYRVGLIRGLMGSGHVFTQGYRDETRDKPWEHWIADPSAEQQKMMASGLLVGVYPRIRFPSFLTNGKINITAMGEGIDAAAEAQFFDSLIIRAGKNLTTEEDGILLGEGLANALAVKPGDVVTVLTNDVRERLNGIDVKVVGVFATGMKTFDDVYFRIQLKGAQALLDTQKVEFFSVGLRDLDNWNAFSGWAQTNLPALQSTAFEEIDKVYYENSVNFLDSQFSMFLTIFLMIGILGVFNITAISVFERTKEFGILRVNGESRWNMGKLVMLETFCMSLAGGVVGILLAYGMNTTLLKNGIFMPPAPGFSNPYYALIKLDLVRALPCFVFGVAASALGAFPAVWKVGRKNLGESLRHT